MLFWSIVGVILAAVFVVAWRHDRRRKGRVRISRSGAHEVSVGEATSLSIGQHQYRDGGRGVGGPL